jgi:hypothetical protein
MDPGSDARQQQRMTAKRKEVVMDADGLAAKGRGPDLCQ